MTFCWHFLPQYDNCLVSVKSPWIFYWIYSGGFKISLIGLLTYYLANFSSKLHENERNWYNAVPGDEWSICWTVMREVSQMNQPTILPLLKHACWHYYWQSCWPLRIWQMSHQRWHIHHICLHHVWTKLPTLALKPRGDITRNLKQGYQWPHKMTHTCPQIFVLKKNLDREEGCTSLVNPTSAHPPPAPSLQDPSAISYVSNALFKGEKVRELTIDLFCLR